MSTGVREAVGAQLEERVAQPVGEGVTPEEWLLLRLYRQLDAGDQEFMRRAIEALASRLE